MLISQRFTAAGSDLRQHSPAYKPIARLRQRSLPSPRPKRKTQTNTSGASRDKKSADELTGWSRIAKKMKTVYIMPPYRLTRRLTIRQHYVIRRTGKIAFLHGCKKAVHPQRHYFSGFGFSFSALTQSPAFHPSAFCVITKQNYALVGEREFATQKISLRQIAKQIIATKLNAIHCRKSFFFHCNKS